MEIMEQLTYMLFVKRLDDLETLEENKSRRLEQPMERFSSCHRARSSPSRTEMWERCKHASADLVAVR